MNRRALRARMSLSRRRLLGNVYSPQTHECTPWYAWVSPSAWTYLRATGYYTRTFEKWIDSQWRVVSKSGPRGFGEIDPLLWVAPLMAPRQHLVRAPYPLAPGQTEVDPRALASYYGFDPQVIAEDGSVVCTGPSTVEFRVDGSWVEYVHRKVRAKIADAHKRVLAQAGRQVLYTIPRVANTDPPTLEQVEQQLRMPSGILDRNFGVVEVDDETWTVRGPAWGLDRHNEAAPVFSDPVIGPMGPPEPETT